MIDMGLGQEFLTHAQEMLGRLGLASPAAHLPALAGPGAWELGELRAMAVLEPDAMLGADGRNRLGCATLLWFGRGHVRLLVSGDGCQLHCLGDPHISARELDLLGVPKERQAQDPVVIGTVNHIRYVSLRRGEREEFAHLCGYEFGSDFSELPVLVYRPHEKRLELVGGVYRVGRMMGIVC